MILEHEDHIALRAAEERHPALHEADEERIADLIAAGYLLKTDAGEMPETTKRGQLEWRCASTEDLMLAMRMDDIFRPRLPAAA